MQLQNPLPDELVLVIDDHISGTYTMAVGSEEIVKRTAIVGVGAAAILAIVSAWPFWQYFRFAVLTPPELKLNHAHTEPPPGPVIFKESYGEMPRRLCDKSEPLIDTNVCDVVRLPELFADKCIRVAARFETDGLENSVIVEESCGERGLVPWTTSQAEKKPSVVKFDDAIWHHGRPGAFDKRITARFTGRFVWSPNTEHETRVLEISSVSNLKVKKTPQR